MRSDGLLTVVEVSRRTGLSRKALRVYEEAGIVVPTGRTTAGYRLYGTEALRRLELLRRAKALGLHLREMTEFLQVAEGCCDKSHPELVMLVREKLVETEERLTDLQQLHATLSDTLHRLVHQEHREEHGCNELLSTCQVIGKAGTSVIELLEIQPIRAVTASCDCGCACCGPAAGREEQEVPQGTHDARTVAVACSCSCTP
jgi:MerR family copper efflux transcriptional regulator